MAAAGQGKHCTFADVPGSLATLLFHYLTSSLSHQMSQFRTEKDTMGQVQVPADAYWGAQTQRSIENFPIAQDINKMPKEIIKAFAYLKKAAALTNRDAGVLDAEKAELIGKVAD